MATKKQDLVRQLESKIESQKKGPNVAGRFGQGAAALVDRKEQRRLDAVCKQILHEQERNREDARERLKELILKAAEPPPPPRRKTKPTKGSVERRLKAKTGRGEIKKMRGRPDGD